MAETEDKLIEEVDEGNKTESEEGNFTPTEVIFFNDNIYCRNNCVRNKSVCSHDCSYKKIKYLVYLLEHAEYSIDVCIYLITCNDLALAIIKAFRRGVNVRIIVDRDMGTSTGSKINWFAKEGIEVKSNDDEILMHHKFCLIDVNYPQQKLITGSLNWTLQGLAGNFEYLTIIYEPTCVQSYLNEFNLLWNTFTKHPIRKNRESLAYSQF